MKTIIFEQEIYKVTEKEFVKIKDLEQKVKDTAAYYKEFFAAEERLFQHLDDNKHLYRFVGVVDFHSQR